LETAGQYGPTYSVHLLRARYLESFFWSQGKLASFAGRSYVTPLVSGGGRQFFDVDNNQILAFDGAGLLKTVQPISSGPTNVSYVTAVNGAGANQLVKDRVSHWTGRQIVFGTQLINGALKTTEIIDASTNGVSLSYNSSGHLAALNWASGHLFEFEYAKSSKPWALTAIKDSPTTVLREFDYDEAGNAISTKRSGVPGYRVLWEMPPQMLLNEYWDASQQAIIRDFSWQPPVGSKLIDPAGNEVSIESKQTAIGTQLTSMSQPAGSGCLATVKRQDYDAKGNLAWREDFKGYRTCFANDQVRNLETGRVEGLATDTACEGVLASTTLPASSRRITTQWHPIWRLEVKTAEPRRLVTKVYNGQPDPFNGGATRYCAPPNGTLPDGSPIVVLCKEVEEATTDASGALGFSAAIDTGSVARVQQWTYNQYGQVLTAKDPLNNTTTYTYYSSSGADYTMGDLATVTNALNQVTRYTKYNAAGQWLEMLDVNNVSTTRTFDQRQRLKTSTTAGLTTSYDYWPTGLLKAVTLPDASSINYGYDDAHRLTSVTDNLGNKITYTLDSSGNRIGENVTDPTGRLAKALTRVPDALNRIQQVSGRP
jgi:YD repeat-containing protein